MNSTRTLARAAVLALLLGATAQAHHSVAMFDQTRNITVEGEVKEWQWTNPHAWLQLVVTDANGQTSEQGFELGSPNTLTRDGFKKTSFNVGDKVTVVAAPRRDGTVGGLFLCGRTASGQWLRFGMGPNSTPVPACQH
ncbi:MAG: DUF6152 family protein [Steroidobacteraceae bacterium]